MELIKNISLVIGVITGGIFIIKTIWNAIEQIISFVNKNNRRHPDK